MTELKTKASEAAIDMLPTVEEALRDQLLEAEEGYVFPRAGLRLRNLYQTRHTFAPLMLQAGEDPAGWDCLP